MAVIHLGATEYRARVPGSYSEADFEKVIFSHRETLFPDEHLVYFKADVRWGNEIRRADFALIDKQYRYWVVIEVELAHHDFQNHVFPQVEVLRNGEYSDRHSEALSSENHFLDRSKVENLVVGSNPQVWVIVDRPIDAWRNSLKALRVSLGVIEVYESGRASIALRVAGTRPSMQVARVGTLTNLMGRVWKLEGFPEMRKFLGSEVAITFEENEWQWTVKILGGHLSIVSSGETMPLDTSRRYFLTQFDDGALSLSAQKPREKVESDEV